MLTETLARFVIETRTSDLPDAAIAAARDALVDTVGVALAGSREPVADLAARWVRDLARAGGERLGTMLRSMGGSLARRRAVAADYMKSALERAHPAGQEAEEDAEVAVQSAAGAATSAPASSAASPPHCPSTLHTRACAYWT